MTMQSDIVKTFDDMRAAWGLPFDGLALAKASQAEVPSNLWPLLPYAQIWGISDDWARESLVRRTPPALVENLKQVVTLYDDLLDDWLAGSEASSLTPSDSYVAFSAMRMAADFAS